MPFKMYNHQQPHFITFAVIDWIDVFTKPIYKKIAIDNLDIVERKKGANSWLVFNDQSYSS